MLKSISLKNFQSHKDTHLEFHPGINVIVGDNRAGKTSILRALYVAAFNPLGYLKYYRRYQKHWPVIELEWDDHIIARDKDGYLLNGKRYGAVKDTVPKDISNILNLKDINFKMQRDELFLISSSPGARAKIIGSASGLEDQEQLTDYCTKKIRETTDNIKAKEHLKTILKKRVSELKDINRLAIKFSIFDKRLEEIEAIETAFAQVSEAVKELSNLQLLLDEEERIISMRERVVSFRGFEKEEEEIGNIIADLQSVLLKLKDPTMILAAEDSLRKIRKKMDGLLVEENKANEIKKETREIKNLVTGLFDVQTKMTRVLKTHKEARVEWERLMKELGKCPFCGK